MTETHTLPDRFRTLGKLPRVRSAVPADFDAIMAMCRELYAENGAVNVDWPSVTDAIIDGVNGKQSCLGVIGEPCALEAMIYLRISRMWYSTEIILEELFCYVTGAHRRSNNAKALLQFARTSSDKLGVPLLIGIISNERTVEKVRLYSRHLGAPAGAFFLHNAKTGNR